MDKYIDKTELREEAKKIQQQRYDLCNAKGHQIPNEEAEMCDYCNRHLTQTIPQKLKDKIFGLSKIMEELKSS